MKKIKELLSFVAEDKRRREITEIINLLHA